MPTKEPVPNRIASVEESTGSCCHFVEKHPFPLAIVSFLLGVVASVFLVGDFGNSKRRRRDSATARLGRQLLEALSLVAPHR